MKINMKNIKIQNNKNRGFSLVEMLVAIAVFMTIMTIAVSALMTILDSNKKAQAIKTTIDNVTFVIEDISRDMRMGSGYQCSLSSASTDWTTDCDGGKAVRFINNSSESNNYIEYIFSTTTDSQSIIKKLACPSDQYTNCVSSYLISEESNIDIENMSFYIIGATSELSTDPTLRSQPRLIITASGKIISKGSEPTSFNLQTNISQRKRQSI
jgi:prepilin-type N-terminal cleavage/methylation domain-containing protein